VPTAPGTRERPKRRWLLRRGARTERRRIRGRGVRDGSGTPLGPFPTITNIKYTEANGANPSIKAGPGAVDWRIEGQGDAFVMFTDDLATRPTLPAASRHRPSDQSLIQTDLRRRPQHPPPHPASSLGPGEVHRAATPSRYECRGRREEILAMRSDAAGENGEPTQQSNAGIGILLLSLRSHAQENSNPQPSDP
jgi:hypothetical protein